MDRTRERGLPIADGLREVGRAERQLHRDQNWQASEELWAIQQRRLDCPHSLPPNGASRSSLSGRYMPDVNLNVNERRIPRSGLPNEMSRGQHIEPSGLGDPYYLFSPLPMRTTQPQRSRKRLITFKWVKCDLIGDGTGGRVYRAINLKTREMIVVKQVGILKTDNSFDPKHRFAVEALQSESDILNDLEHPHIVQYLGFRQTVDTVNTFFEYVSGGSIGDALRKHGKFRDEVARSFSLQITKGLAFLHALGIIHRDIKGDNILVDLRGRCKISDFKLSRRCANVPVYETPLDRTMRRSFFWMAPEIINNQGYNAKVDIWSIGCVALEMQTGQRPWANDGIFAVMHKVGILQQAPPVPEGLQMDLIARDFRQWCFAVDPASRLTADQLLLHSWLRIEPGWTFEGFLQNDADGPPIKSSAGSQQDEWANLPASARETWEMMGGNCTIAVQTSSCSDEDNESLTSTNPSRHSKESEDESVIGSSMVPGEIIAHLIQHGCKNITDALESSNHSTYPVSTGGFGDVYRERLTSGLDVAVKCMRLINPCNGEQKQRKHLKHAAREIHTWSKIQHPYVLKLLGLVEYRDQIGMVSPWVEGGSLRNYLRQNLNLDRPRLCTQIADGLSYLHQCGVIHGDLKGDNVLVSDKGDPLITDFGNAVLLERTLQFTYTTARANLSPRWTAPELLNEISSYSTEADVFALGMTILEAISGKVPFAEMKDMAVLFAIGQNKPPTRPKKYIPITSKGGDLLWSLLERCWNAKPELRPTAAWVRDELRVIKPEDLLGCDIK